MNREKKNCVQKIAFICIPCYLFNDDYLNFATLAKQKVMRWFICL